MEIFVEIFMWAMACLAIGLFATVVVLGIREGRRANSWLRFWQNRTAFSHAFGFELPSPPVEEEELKRHERKVGEILQTLAAVFARADLAEREVVSTSSEAKGRLVKETLGIRRADLQVRVREAKTEFWEAHRLAKWAGFSVKESYKDYLDEELRQQVERRG